MFDETRFTTTNTGRPAPTWEQRAGMPTLYWRDDEWDAMQERNRREDDNQRIADFAEAIETRSTPFARGTKSGNCIVCEKPFTNGQPDQITCAREACKAERQKQRVRKAEQRRQERNKLAAMMKSADAKRQMSREELTGYAEQALSKAHMVGVKQAFRETRGRD